MFAQHANDLRRGEPTLLHVRFLVGGLSLKPRNQEGGRSALSYSIFLGKLYRIEID